MSSNLRKMHCYVQSRRSAKHRSHLSDRCIASLKITGATAANILVVALTLAASPKAVADDIEQQCLSNPNFGAPVDLRAGDCIEFWNEMDSTYCREVFSSEKSLGWFRRLVQVGSHLIGQQCEEGSAEFHLDAHQRYGGLNSSFTEIRRSSDGPDGWSVDTFPVPELGYFSSPVFCGSKIAYWQVGEFKVGIAVFDAERKAIIRHFDYDIDAAQSPTDHFDLPAPEWDNHCRTVRFRADQFVLEPFDRIWTIPD